MKLINKLKLFLALNFNTTVYLYAGISFLFFTDADIETLIQKIKRRSACILKNCIICP